MPIKRNESVTTPKTRNKNRKRKHIKISELMKKVFYPWPNIASCEHFNISFAPPNSQPVVALASFPGSGNSWLRYLLEGSTGMFTGSVYGDKTLYKKGLYGELMNPFSGTTIAIKTHSKSDTSFGRALLIIRNPFEALISWYNLRLFHSHTKAVEAILPNDKEWTKFVYRTEWDIFYKHWLNLPKENLHIIFYEEMKQDPLKTLEEIHEFLHYPVNSQRMQCLSKQLEGNLKRPAVERSDPFSDDLKKEIYKEIAEVNKLLVQKTQKTLPTHLYKYFNH